MIKLLELLFKNLNIERDNFLFKTFIMQKMTDSKYIYML